MIDFDARLAEVPYPSFLGVGTARFTNIGPINIIFGPNGSGKSQLTRAMFGTDPERYALISPERPGDFAYNPSYASEEERGTSRVSSRSMNITVDYRMRVFSRLSSYLKIRGTTQSPDTSTHFDRIIDFMNLLLPDFKFEHTTEQGKDFIIKHASNDFEANSSNMSSGEADLFAVGLDMISMCLIWRLSETADPVLFLDEPNVHLHPDLDEKLVLGLRYLYDEFGVRLFVASHSTSLLACLVNTFKEDARLFYLKRGQSEINGVSPTNELKALSTIMGGSTVLGGLFGLKIVIVEGDDDFEVWNQVARSDAGLRLSILPPAGGKPKQARAKRTLEALFSSLGYSRNLGYVLQDRDGRTTSPRPRPGDKLHTVWLGCREVENLYLSAQVLESLGFDDTTAKQKLLEEGLDAQLLNRIFADKIGSHEVKPHISEISAALGHKLDRWQQRIGRVVGKERPTGELAEFLGGELIHEWWGPVTSDQAP